MLTAIALLKLRMKPNSVAKKTVGRFELQAEREEDLDQALDEMIDHLGPAEQLFYTVKDGRKIKKYGNSL